MEHEIGEIITLPDGRKVIAVDVETDGRFGCLYHIIYKEVK